MKRDSLSRAIFLSSLLLLSEFTGHGWAGLALSQPAAQSLQYEPSITLDKTPNRTRQPPPPTKKSPIILVPGDGGSQLFAKLDKPEVVHYFCDQKTDSEFNLWLNMALLVPFVIDCWIDNMRLVYNHSTRRTQNSPGVEISIKEWGNTTTIEYVDPSQIGVTVYFNVLVNYFVERGYTRGVNLRGAPYDFRKAPNELEDFYKKIKTLVEETYNLNNQSQVTLVCHSMGCPIMLYFLNRNVHQSWKDTYIKSFVTLAAPWGGAVKSLKAFTSGDNLGVIVVPVLTIRKDERTFPSLAYLLPSDQFWNHSEVLMTNGQKNYTTANLDQLFDDIDYDVGKQMWLDTRNLTRDMIHPGVDVHCIHGGGIATMQMLEYRSDKFPDHNPKITYGDGDSTVNTKSLEGCLRWTDESKKQGKKLVHMNITGVDHMSVMTDARILRHLYNITTEE